MPKGTWQPNLSKPLADVLAEIGEVFPRAAEVVLAGEWRGSGRFCPAARYSLLVGGKRLRPALVILGAHATGMPRVSGHRLLSIAVAVEMIHTYSLIHDDLPCMDDDAIRRGAPTCHVAHGVADATWAGTALMVRAFQSLARGFFGTESLPVAARIMAEAAGFGGMVGGQWLDTELPASAVAPELFAEVHARKTAALIAGCCALGGLAGGSDDAAIRALCEYGSCLGRAFQAVDDLLDAMGDERMVGKRVGKDAAAGKLTAPSALGIEGTRTHVEGLAAQAVASLEPLSGPAIPLLRELAVQQSRRSN